MWFVVACDNFYLKTADGNRRVVVTTTWSTIFYFSMDFSSCRTAWLPPGPTWGERPARGRGLLSILEQPSEKSEILQRTKNRWRRYCLTLYSSELSIDAFQLCPAQLCLWLICSDGMRQYLWVFGRNRNPKRKSRVRILTFCCGPIKTLPWFFLWAF